MSPELAFKIVARNDTARGFSEVAAQAKATANAVAATAQPMTRAFQAANGNVANLAAQFQDIGVQLAGGTSPLLIALQQGTQIGAALGPGGAAGATKALGAAFLSLLNPVNLVTIGAIALGGAVVQWLASLGTEGPKAEDTLKRHSEWLQSILDGYDDAQKAAQQYVNESTKLPQGAVQSELSTQQVAAQERYLAALQAIKDVRTSGLQAEIQLLQVAGENTAAQLAQADAIQALQAQLSVTNPDLDEFVTQLTVIKNSTADETIRDIAVKLLQLAGNARAAGIEVGSLNVAIAQTATAGFRGLGVDEAIAQIKRLTPDLRSAKEQVQGLFSLYAPEARTTSELEALAKAAAAAEAALDKQEKNRKSGGVAAKVKDTLATLRPIDTALKETNERIADLVATLSDTATNAVTGFFSALAKGQDVVSALRNQFASLTQTLANKALNSAFNSLFGSMFGTGFGSIGNDIGGNVTFAGVTAFANSARGNVFSTPALSALSGSLVTQPTQFAFARGAAIGTMGEAGAEAIMPLKRGRDGKLGVAGGMAQPIINIHNYAGADVSTSQNRDGSIDVLVRAVEKQVKTNMARGQYRSVGVNPGTTRR